MFKAWSVTLSAKNKALVSYKVNFKAKLRKHGTVEHRLRPPSCPGIQQQLEEGAVLVRSCSSPLVVGASHHRQTLLHFKNDSPLSLSGLIFSSFQTTLAGLCFPKVTLFHPKLRLPEVRGVTHHAPQSSLQENTPLSFPTFSNLSRRKLRQLNATSELVDR